MRFVLLHELLGLSAAQADTTMAQAIPRLENPPDSSFRIASGINPHAPYSVGRELRNLIRDYLAGHPGVPCAWHLHESCDEINYFATGTGTLAELLASLGSPAPFDETPACAAMEFLGREGLLNSVNIAFHLNFSTDDEAQLFAAPRGVVHCPPAHAYFGREPFPMYRMMNAGANVCLGTDSLASGQTLSMFEVLRMAAREFPFLSGGQLLALVTTNPARMTVLANAPPLGVIARGAAADFASFSAPATVTRELRALLMDSRTEVRDVFVAGAQLNG
jgi:cytosine/adenosine deaminase-related metal-dependent hydrolase